MELCAGEAQACLGLGRKLSVGQRPLGGDCHMECHKGRSSRGCLPILVDYVEPGSLVSGRRHDAPCATERQLCPQDDSRGGRGTRGPRSWQGETTLAPFTGCGLCPRSCSKSFEMGVMLIQEVFGSRNPLAM